MFAMLQGLCATTGSCRRWRRRAPPPPGPAAGWSGTGASPRCSGCPRRDHSCRQRHSERAAVLQAAGCIPRTIHTAVIITGAGHDPRTVQCSTAQYSDKYSPDSVALLYSRKGSLCMLYTPVIWRPCTRCEHPVHPVLNTLYTPAPVLGTLSENVGHATSRSPVAGLQPSPATFIPYLDHRNTTTTTLPLTTPHQRRIA